MIIYLTLFNQWQLFTVAIYTNTTQTKETTYTTCSSQHTPRIRRKYIRKQIFFLLNNSPEIMVDKINTYSMKGFSTSFKNYLIDV